ncbi:MAG TPA: alpha/beta hydrolase-fold protein [Opitutus sp.]|nr:alpha/beta hydrolase-fold protein [Opitutus sp.]
MAPPITRAKPAFRCNSPETGSIYSIYIDAPDPAAAAGPWPAVLLMDGDFFFDPAVAAVRELRAAGKIPPTLVAGIGYGASFGQPGNHRGRDYTPTASALEPTSGGADAFLSFLANTFWPELARRYPLRADQRVVAGHSLGSLLALYALFQPEPFFPKILASAPSVWWDDRALLAHATKLRDAQSSLSGSLYLGVGADDTPSMTGDLALLEQQLAARPFEGLNIVSEKFPGRDHYNVVVDTLRSGLRALLGS